jgi:hypothetical protein
MRRAAVLGLLGCITAVSCGCGTTSGGAAGQPASFLGYGGTAIVSADGRTVTVGPYLPACPAKVTVVARESATQVALFLRYLTPSHPSACPQAMPALVDSRDVRLDAPLGNRKLVDGATGRPTAWISARLVLRPNALPAGVRLFELIPAVNHSRPQSPGPAGCVQFYSWNGDPNYLEIVQSAGSLKVPRPAKGGLTRIRVRGHPGLAARNLITWRENGLTDYILAGPGPAGPQVMSTQQLIAIADSSPPA